MQNLIVGLLIILMAGFIQSATGFGFALVATPLLLFVLEPKSVVATVIILASINSIILLFYYRHHVDIRRVVFIVIGSVLGIPLGAHILSSINPTTVKLVIAILIIPLSIALLLGRSYRIKRENLGQGVVGFISGTLASSTSLSGPPVILFLLSQDLEKKQFIGTINGCFLLTGLITIGTFVFMDIVTMDVLRGAGILLPVLALGFYIGTKVVGIISATVFRRIAASIIFLSALSIIVTVCRQQLGHN